MSPDFFAAFFQPAFLFKIVLGIGLFFFVVFAFVVFTQIRAMNRIVHQDTSSAVLEGVALVFLAAGVLLLIITIVVL